LFVLTAALRLKSLKLNETVSFKVTPEINASSGVFRHPLLAVPMCKACNNYYNDGEWAKDDEGCDMFCR
jgi:Cysteine Rich ADD domain